LLKINIVNFIPQKSKNISGLKIPRNPEGGGDCGESTRGGTRGEGEIIAGF
jgi:hypothetical protein